MGIYLSLYAQYEHIDSQEWEAVYFESLELLKHFPGRLTKVRAESKGKLTRLVISEQLQSDLGLPTERIEIDGDLSSGRFAETFRIYRHVSHYQQLHNSDYVKSKSPADILWLPKDRFRQVETSGAQIFDEKTQGYPYHFAVLAIALLFENAFPGRAIVMGDICKLEAQRVLAWIKYRHNKKMSLPVVTDAPALWSRLTKTYPQNPKAALERFLNIYSESDMEPWSSIRSMKNPPVASLEKALGEIELRANRATVVLENASVKTPETFLLDELERQRIKTTERQKAANVLGNLISKFMQKERKQAALIESSARMRLLEEINRWSSTNGIALSAAAWERIDLASNLDELRSLAALSMIPNFEINFCFWRRHVLESADLWPLLCVISNCKINESTHNEGSKQLCLPEISEFGDGLFCDDLSSISQRIEESQPLGMRAESFLKGYAQGFAESYVKVLVHDLQAAIFKEHGKLEPFDQLLQHVQIKTKLESLTANILDSACRKLKSNNIKMSDGADYWDPSSKLRALLKSELDNFIILDLSDAPRC